MSIYSIHSFRALYGAFLFLLTDVALAQLGGGGGGFLAPVSNTLQKFIDGIVLISGIIAIGVVVWHAIEWALDHKTLADIGGICFKAILIGGAPYLATKLWELGKTMSWL